MLAPGAPVQLGFQVGDEPLRMTEALGEQVSLVFHRRQSGRVAALLRAAGLEVRAVVRKERDTEGPFPERVPQGFVLARRPREGLTPHTPGRTSGGGRRTTGSPEMRSAPQ
ncbi:hypothetical protein ACFYL8_17395 [Streptomyces cyaneofuscatus]|uniref:hypothetical protein n=1 Tax=Streptomyces cyaneofuscatus TaxID=66883 RepID=UPI0036A4E88F